MTLGTAGGTNEGDTFFYQPNDVLVAPNSDIFIEEWKHFGRPSGLYIDKNDVLYVADSESDDVRNPGGLKRGIRAGSARDGKLTALIPDPWTAEPRPATTSPEGVVADAAGNIYGACVTETTIAIREEIIGRDLCRTC
jgi:hypothetical protein